MLSKPNDYYIPSNAAPSRSRQAQARLQRFLRRNLPLGSTRGMGHSASISDDRVRESGKHLWILMYFYSQFIHVDLHVDLNSRGFPIFLDSRTMNKREIRICRNSNFKFKR